MDGHSRVSDTWSKASLEEVLRCLQDLIEFFAQPDADSEKRLIHLDDINATRYSEILQ